MPAELFTGERIGPFSVLIILMKGVAG